MTPDCAIPYAVANARAAALAAGRPITRCPECGAPLSAPRAPCAACGRPGWCPVCGQCLYEVFTRRCAFCGALLACPHCGHALCANPCGGGPPCRCPSPQCLHCGYDLTGNTTGRCPECGRDNTIVSDGRGLRPLLNEPEKERRRQAVKVLLVITAPLSVFAVAALAWVLNAIWRRNG